MGADVQAEEWRAQQARAWPRQVHPGAEPGFDNVGKVIGGAKSLAVGCHWGKFHL